MNEAQLTERMSTLLDELGQLNAPTISERRNFTFDEQRKWDAGMAEVAELKKERKLSRSLYEPIRPDPAHPFQERGNRVTMEDENRISLDTELRATGYRFNEDYINNDRDVFNKLLRYGAHGLSGNEVRAMQADGADLGGFTMPVGFQKEVVRDLKETCVMMQLGRVIELPKGDSLVVPKMADPAAPTWGAELSVGDEDSSAVWSQLQFTPHPIASYIRCSKTLLRRSAINPEDVIREALLDQCSEAIEAGFLTGTGAAGQPLGLFTAADTGVSTARDMSTSNTTTAVKFDNLIRTIGHMKGTYRTGAVWIGSRTWEQNVRLLKDGNGSYIFTPTGGHGDVSKSYNGNLYGFPMWCVESAPNTWTTGKYVAAFFNPRFYWIVVALNMEVQVLTELYAATNQNGYVLRMEVDGMPVQENAFVRVKLA